MNVTKGRVLAQRFYDIADEIDLAKAESLLREQLQKQPAVRKVRHLRIPHPPIEVALTPRQSGVPGLKPGEVRLRVYDVGVLAITFEIHLPAPLDNEGLVRFSAAVLNAADAITEAGREVARDVAAAIRTACQDPKLSELSEDFTIIAIEETDPVIDAEGVSRELDLPRILLGELGPLSTQERAEALRRSYCYDPKELVLVTWSSALIFGREGLAELQDLLEVAGMQLLELRHYDEVVRRSLDRLYDELALRHSAFSWSGRFRRLSREILRLFVEVTEVSARVENSLQWFGDTFYARVHRAAVEAFDIPRWQRQLEEKLDLLKEINELIVSQITTRQSLGLETAIVLLIVLEIVMALFKLM